jgi:DNA-binding transcriptional MerR regulator
MNKGTKTGRVAKMFDIDPKTIYAWVERYGEFFSSEARAEDSKFRKFNPDDLILLNTIRVERANGTDWDTLNIKLESGVRDTNLPPEATTIEGDTAVMLYVQISTLRAQLDNSEKERERLLKIDEKKDQTIADLNREIGRMEAKLEILKEQRKSDS